MCLDELGKVEGRVGLNLDLEEHAGGHGARVRKACGVRVVHTEPVDGRKQVAAHWSTREVSPGFCQCRPARPCTSVFLASQTCRALPTGMGAVAVTLLYPRLLFRPGFWLLGHLLQHEAKTTLLCTITLCPPSLSMSPSGFGLLGHLLEVCRGSRLTARVSAGAVPLMAAAPALAQAGVLPGAVARNWESYGASVRLGPAVQVGKGRACVVDAVYF